MMKNMLGSLALVVSLVPAGGCVVTAHARVPEPVAVVEVDTDPPPPRYEEVVVRPGFFWIQGHWYQSGGQWVWMGGHYERERAGYAWEPGRWETRGRGRVWVEGSWRAGAAAAPGPAVRDHRHPEPPPPARGPAVRDHRR
jgi:hypothetical protein